MIEVTIQINEKVIKELVKTAGWKITNKAGFKELLKTPKFAEALGDDLLTVWRDQNADCDDLDVVMEGLGLDAVAEYKD